jgi:hypothetical protein
MERAATGLQINSNYFAISGYIQARYWRTQIKISSVGKPRPLKSDMADTSAINDQSVIDLPNCPFGGEKNSGIGRFNGNWVIEAFTTDQWATVQHTPRRYPWTARDVQGPWS